MAEKGQITIEGILIFGFFILIFVGISFPAMLKVYRASNDAAVVLEGRGNLNTVVSAVKVARTGGTGSVKTVTLKSASKNWKISSYLLGETLSYWMEWSSPEDIPSELIIDGSWGGIGESTIEGISSNGTESSSPSLSAGSYKVRVENAASGTSPRIFISSTLINGDTINITLVD